MGLKINEDTAVLEKDRADFQTVYNLFFMETRISFMFVIGTENWKALLP